MATSGTCHFTGISLSMSAITRRSLRFIRKGQLRAVLGSAVCFVLATLAPGAALATQDCVEGKSPPYKLSWTILIVLVGGGIRLAIRFRRMPGGYFARYILPYVLVVSAAIVALSIVAFMGLTGLCLPDAW